LSSKSQTAIILVNDKLATSCIQKLKAMFWWGQPKVSLAAYFGLKLSHLTTKVSPSINL